MTPLVLVLGTADWNAAIATNQHRATDALAQRYEIVFAEGAGTRRLKVSDAGRVLRRLRPQPATAGRAVPDGVQIVSPRILPHHAPSTRALNSVLLHRQVQRWIDHPGPRLLWTYTPFTYGLEGFADRTVYHLVDLLHQNPGVHSGRLLDVERSLGGRVDLGIATSPAIAEHLRTQGFRDVRCLPNVADVDLFADAARRNVSRETSVVFAGTIAPHKIDLELLADLSKSLRPNEKLRLIGPVVGSVPGFAELVGPLGPQALARELARASVGIVPYRLSPLTAGISPLKTFEYLAAGLPVVSTVLPAVEPIDGAVHVENRSDFVSRVLDLLRTPDAGRAARMTELARGRDWGSRGEVLRGLVEDLLAV